MHISQLTQADFDKFLGGQLEAYNPEAGYRYLGEVQSIVLGGMKQPVLHVNFNWAAQGGESWTPVPCFVYTAKLNQYLLAEITTPKLVLHSFVNGETATFHTPDGEILDLTKVDLRDLVGASH